MRSYFVFAYVVRVLAYLLIALSLGFLLFSEQLSINCGYLIGACLLYPHLLYLIERCLKDGKRRIARYFWLFFDAIVVGFIVVFLQFAPLFLLITFLPISFFAVVTGGVFVYLLCLIITTSVAFSVHILELAYLINIEFPLEILWAQTVATLLCVALVGFYVYWQHAKLIATNHNLIVEQEKSQMMADKLSKYLAPQVWQMVFSGQNQMQITTERKKLSVFFADIQGFTEVAETLAAEDLTRMLNNYLADIAQIALAYGGTLDKFIGDAVMVFFGDFNSGGSKNDALHTTAMAIAIRKHMQELQRRWRRQGIGQNLNIRMGINTGFCTVGNFGTDKRMEYTAIGKEVNLASRLEGLAEAGEILISEETYLLIRDQVLCLDKGLLNIKGYKRPVQTYQVVDFRKALGEDSSYLTVDLPGFSLALDLKKIRNNKDKVKESLKKALHDLKD